MNIYNTMSECKRNTKKQILDEISNFVDEIIQNHKNEKKYSYIKIWILNTFKLIFKKNDDLLDNILESLKEYIKKIGAEINNENNFKSVLSLFSNFINKEAEKNYNNTVYKDFIPGYFFELKHSYNEGIKKVYVEIIENIYKTLLQISDPSKNKFLYHLITNKDCEDYTEKNNNDNDQENYFSGFFEAMEEAVAKAAVAKAAAAAAAAKAAKEAAVETETAPIRQEHEAVAFTHLRANLSGPKERQVFMDNHPDKLFRTFKTNIQNVSSSPQDINDLFNSRGDFSQIYDELKNTKLSKKEKIKILFLCGFQLIDPEEQQKLNTIKTEMLKENYVADLIKYLNDNQHMIATQMFYDRLNNEPKQSYERYNKVEHIKIDGKHTIRAYNLIGDMYYDIPLETQVIYLLHNVMMD